MDTALALHKSGLEFVVAPLPTRTGATVHRLGAAHTLTVFPYLDGVAGQFGEEITDADRDALIDLLARLHSATPAATRALVREPTVPAQALEAVLDDATTTWTGGPYAGPARELVAAHAKQLQRAIGTLRELNDRVRDRPAVITHGEPHPGNILRTPGGRLLIDWDTVGLAAPERDLWMLATDSGRELDRYAELTGRSPDPAGIALYRLRWDLEDIAVFLHLFRSPHGDGPDITQAWVGLREAIGRL